MPNNINKVDLIKIVILLTDNKIQEKDLWYLSMKDLAKVINNEIVLLKNPINLIEKKQHKMSYSITHKLFILMNEKIEKENLTKNKYIVNLIKKDLNI